MCVPQGRHYDLRRITEAFGAVIDFSTCSMGGGSEGGQRRVSQVRKCDLCSSTL